MRWRIIQGDKWLHPFVGIGLYLLLLFLWWIALRVASVDTQMGEIYRAIYVHVPAAFTAFGLAFVLFVLSVMVFLRERQGLVFAARAVSGVGCVMTLLTLVTGSLWGYPTWGTFWSWDARLTTTLILALLYGGYLLLYQALPLGPMKGRICAALGMMIFVDVVIVYKSVSWWRTLHQPPTLLRSGGAALDPQMLALLLAIVAGQSLFCLWLVLLNLKSLALAEQLEVQLIKQLSADVRHDFTGVS